MEVVRNWKIPGLKHQKVCGIEKHKVWRLWKAFRSKIIGVRFGGLMPGLESVAGLQAGKLGLDVNFANGEATSPTKKNSFYSYRH